MISVLQLGPLAVPLPPLVVALAAALGLALGKRVGRSSGLDVEVLLLRMLLLGLLAARLGFVWTWRGVYLHDPLAILDIRDGGWEPVIGFAAACVYGLSLVRRQPVLRSSIVAATVATLLSWTTGSVVIAALSAGSGAPLPALSLPGLDGQSVSLAGFTGKPTVINLWATWCPPCQREMPVLQQAQSTHTSVNFVFIDQGEASGTVIRFLQQQGLSLQNVLLDPRRAAGAAFDASSLPTTLFFDAQGRLVSTRVGALSEATLADRLADIHGGASGMAPKVEGEAAPARK